MPRLPMCCLRLPCLIAGLFFTTGLGAQVRPDDLVLWYDFSEMEGTTVKDLSGNGQDGTASGGPTLEDAPFGKALKFDGNGDKVTVEYDPAMDVPAYTVALWLKSVQSNESWVGVFGRPGRHYNLWAGSSNSAAWFIHHRYRDGGNNNAGAGDYRSVPHGEWVHIALTNDGKSTSASYVNGERKATGVVSNLTYMSNRLYIGANNDNGNGAWYEGLMDDVRLYKVALSAEEVSAAYNQGKGDFNVLPVVTPVGEAFVRIPLGGTYEESGATVEDPEDGTITEITQTVYQPASKMDSNIAAWWQLDEKSGTEAADSVRPGTAGVLKGDPQHKDGRLGGGLLVDGDDYVEAASFDALKNAGSGSIAFWVRPTGGNYVFWADGLALVERQGTKLRLRWNLEGDWRNTHVTQPNSLPDGVWSHWVFSFKDGETTLYKDGQSVFTSSDTQKTFTDRAVDVKFGWRDGHAGFQGSIDDLRIYKSALDEAAAAAAYQSAGRLTAETVDTSVLGDWTVHYAATDSAGATGEVERTVRVFDPAAPVITLKGDALIVHQVVTEYNDAGATVADADGNALDAKSIQVDGIVDGGADGTYVLAYDFTDAQGRPAETVYRTIVVADYEPPTLTLHGKPLVRHLLGNPYVDAGASAEDGIDGPLLVDSSLYEWDKLHARGYMLASRPESLMVLDGNGGLLAAKPAGEVIYTSRLEINGDTSFQALGTGITRNDNFQNLFTGVFRATKAGAYEFGMPWPDDLGSIWLDLDRDGVFELDGVRGSEWMDGSVRFGYRQVQLQPGIYKFAVAHMEGGGGSRIQAHFGLPGIVTPLTNTETFESVEALRVRFVIDTVNSSQPCIDELEIYSGNNNVALASLGAVATASSTTNDATHNLSEVNDGIYGNSNSWRANTPSAWVQIDLAELTSIDRIVWSRDRLGRHGDRLPTSYRIDVITELGGEWQTLVEHQDRPLRNTVHPGSYGQEGIWGVEKPLALNKTGSFEITYRAVDAAGNEVTTKRTILVVDSIDSPVITLHGEARMEVSIGSEFTEPGYAVKSAFGEDLEASGVQVYGVIDTSISGEQVLTYNFIGEDGIPAEAVQRTVVMVDREAPVLTLLGDAEITLKVGKEFIDPGATVADNSGATLVAYSNLGFPREGLVLHLDASRLNLSEGDALSTWPDLSGQNNDASAVAGEPTFALGGLNGRPAVQIDGKDLVRAQTSFNNRYSIFTVSRLSGGSNERLISSASNNWILGYHGGFEDRMHADQWVYMSDVVGTKDPHLYTAISTGDHNTRFYADSREAVQYSSRNGQIGQLQFGGYQNGSDPGWGYIAEVLLYNYGAKADVRHRVETYLNAKYGLNGLDAPPVDLSKPGTYHLLYAARDTSGNLGTTTRKIIVTPNTDRPVLALHGADRLHHEAGTEFTDPGAKATDASGNVLEAYVKGQVALKVGRWSDLSGKGNHLLQSDSRYLPAFDSQGFQDQPALVFEEMDTLALASGKDISSQADFTVIAVHEFANPQNGNWNAVVGIQNRDQAHGCLLLQRMDRAEQIGVHRAGRNGNARVKIDQLYGPRVSLLSRFGGDAKGRDGDVTVSSNGLVATGKQTWDTEQPSSRLQVAGRQQGGTGYFSGTVSEIIVLAAGIAQEDRLKVEGHLAHKWKLAGHLPDDHPHKADAPGGWSPAELPELSGWYDAQKMDPGSQPGEFTLTYKFTNTEGLRAEPLVRSVTVADTTPPVITLNGDDVLQVKVGDPVDNVGATAHDLVDGEVLVVDNLKFPKAGLILDLDAASFKDALNDGDKVTGVWVDASGAGNDMGNHDGPGPDWLADGINGEPALRFNGDTYMWTSRNFDNLTDGYTLFTVSRYSGTRMGRVFASRSRNWLFGYHGGYTAAWHAEGWIVNADNDRSQAWHLHTGAIGNELDPEGSFWKNGVQKVFGSRGSNNGIYKPGLFAIGGWRNKGEQPSNAEVARVLLYDGVLSESDRQLVELFLNAKYSLNGLTSEDLPSLDTSKPGTKVICYIASDSSGNHAVATRTIHVVEDTSVPVLTLKGEAEMVLSIGAEFADPGVSITDTAGVAPAALTIDGKVDTTKLGEYVLTYTYESGGRKAVSIIREIQIIDDVPPVFTLAGGDTVKLLIGQAYEDAGATATDNTDGALEVHNMPVGPAVYYSFNNAEEAGLDNSGNQANATLMAGAMGGGPGRYGHGLHIPYVPSASLDLGGSEVDLGDEWTIGVWFKNLYGSGKWKSLTRGSIRDHQIIVHVDNHQLGTFTNGQGDWRGSTFRIRPNQTTQWSHVAAVGRGDRTYFYKDGAFATSADRKSTSEVSRVGNWSTDQHFAEHLDEFYVYQRALSEAEVKGLPYANVQTDTSVPGSWKSAYFATDASGNTALALRTIVVEPDPKAGVITLLGESEVTHEAGTAYQDAGATLASGAGQSLPAMFIRVAGMPDGSTAGTHTITYNYTSPSGTQAIEVVRTVQVVDTTPPLITLVGGPIILARGTEFIDPGVRAVDAVDGEVRAIRAGVIPTDGLVLHLDAGRIEGLDEGAVVTNWPDASATGNHADNAKGNPTWHRDALGGRPAVRFDGGDLLWTTTDFSSAKAYSIISVARYTGGDNERVISSRGINWLFGFHANTYRRWYANGWIWNQGGIDTRWHLHAGSMDPDALATLWVDRKILCSDKSGANPANYSPGVIQLGGFNDSNELAKCEVAELLFYDRKLSQLELIAVQSLLDGKYGLGFGEVTTASMLDVNTPGIYTLEYITSDQAGNTATATRKIVVEEGSTLPVITLKGEAEMTIEAGTQFTDPGASVTDAAGNPLDASAIQVSGHLDTSRPGVYNLAYDFISAERKRAVSALRKVTVQDTTLPVITLVGPETLRIPIGGEFSDPGVTAQDTVDGALEVHTSLIQKNRILHQGFQQGWSDLRLYFHGNGGILKDQPSGQTYLDGPLYFLGDASFQAAGVGIDRNDQWQNLFTTTFHAIKDGKYEFAITQRDDWGTFWVDLDQDGTFERNGDFGTEWMNNGVLEGGHTVHLRKGYYKVAIGHMEGGGGSSIRASFRTPEGAGPTLMTTIDPTDPQQDGLWVELTELNLSQAGEHTIEYTAVDLVGNQTKAVRTIIVESVQGVPVIFLEGKRQMSIAAGDHFTDPGATVEDKDGQTLDAAAINVSGIVDTGNPGTYTLKYNFVGQDAIAAKTVLRRVTVTDIMPPVLTLAGEESLRINIGAQWKDPGATATDNVDGVLPVMTSGTFAQKGLVLHLDASRIPLVEDGDPIAPWHDLSGQGNHLDDNIGQGRYVASDIAGLPSVYFDGLTYLASSTAFGRRYTLATVARYDGKRNLRLISSRTHNWIFGFHGNHVNCFHPAGWVAGPDQWQSADTKPHLNIGTSGGGRSQFWGDGLDLTFIPNRIGDIGQFQLGGWGTNGEPASGYVSEVLLYDRVLAPGEIDALHFYLDHKYGLRDDPPVRGPVDTSATGDYEIRYAVVDSSGNRVAKTRTVEVVPAPGAPVITLLGDAVATHEAGTPYNDPGANVADGEGNALDASLIEVSGLPAPSTTGQYLITYNYTDIQGRKAPEVLRSLTVQDTRPPLITLLGDSVIKVEKDGTINDSGATATDLLDGVRELPSPLLYSVGALDAIGYMQQSTDALINLDGNQGVLVADPAPGEPVLYNGTLSLNGDGQFRAACPTITRNDQYQILFKGYFNAPWDGEYEFGNATIDDRMAFWVDLDQDGTFESSGDAGSESFVPNWRTGYRKVTLSKGKYLVAIVFMEYGGGARFQPTVQVPGGKRLIVHPSTQPSLWLAAPRTTIDTSTPGTYTYDYVAMDSAGNEGRATRTVIVVEDISLPFISIRGGYEMHQQAGTAFTDPGAKVTDIDGNTLEADLKGEGTIDAATPGEYILTYKYTDGAGKTAAEVVRKVTVADTVLPTLTLKPHASGGLETVTLHVGQLWEDPGATANDSFDEDVPMLSAPIGAVAKYTFDDPQDPTKDDSEGGKFPGRLVEGAQWGPQGRSGGSLHIPTANANARMEIGPVDIGEAWTAAAWFKELYPSNWRTLFRGQAGDHQLIIENNATNLGLYDNSGGKGFQGTGFNMPASAYTRWHHIAAVGRDGETVFYVDGKKVGEAPVQSQTDIWRIGAWPGQRFAKYLDEVYVFQRALLHGEILALMHSNAGSSVDTSEPGKYQVRYFAMDDSGNVGQTVRNVIVIPDPAAPVLTLNAKAVILHEAGTEFRDPGATVSNADGTPINANLPGTGQVDVKTLGTYTLTYNYKSADGKTALPLERTITVRDTTAPVITLKGSDTVIVAIGDTYVEPGFGAIDSLDGDVVAESNVEFPIAGLMLDLDATYYKDKLGDGENVTTPWLDTSGRNHHMDQFAGAGITWHADAINGEPALRFDGQSMMWTSRNFDEHKGGYTVLTVSRYIDGSKKRVISSRNRNWLFGFWNARTASWHPEGWVYNSDAGGDTDWHLHAGTVNTDADPAASFWKDGILRIAGNQSFNNTWNKPGQIAAGGNWGERSNCEVARILLYDRELSPEIVEVAIRALQVRYSLEGHTPKDKLLDTSQSGEFFVTYRAEDAAGNLALTNRTVIVQDNPPIPEIRLQSVEDDEINLLWEAGAPFAEPGYKLYNRNDKEIDAAAVVVEGSVNHFTLGTYTLTYNYTDEKGNPATQRERTIRVVDTTAPVITLTGGDAITLEIGKPFEDPGYKAMDALDGNVSVKVTLKGRPEGLIANWTFNDGAGDKVTETINGIHASLLNFQNPDLAWKDGKYGKAIEFDGINDYVLVPSASKLDLQQMTLSMWVKAADYAQNGFLFEKTANGSINTQYSLYLEASDQLNYRLVQGGNLNDTRIPANINFAADTWTHLAATYDGTLKTLYVDGELILAMPAIIPINMGPGGISAIASNGAGSDYYFKGLIDEFQIYNRAVPEEQIHALMSPAGIDTSTKTTKPYILVYTATDSSGNTATAEREVIVSNDITPPVITLFGDSEVTIDVGTIYDDASATAIDDTGDNLTSFIENGDTLDAVDTSKPGVYIITYDVEDFSGNKAVQVTRKVTVVSADPFSKWAQGSGLSELPAADRTATADPDRDGIPNLLEYALGGNPVKSNRTILPTFDASGDSIKITFYRLKSTADNSLTMKVELTSDLRNPAAWDDTPLELRGALKGVPQTNLPDGESYAKSKYERIEARATTAKADAGGKQFLRVLVEKP